MQETGREYLTEEKILEIPRMWDVFVGMEKRETEIIGEEWEAGKEGNMSTDN